MSADGRTVIYAREDEAHPPEFWATNFDSGAQPGAQDGALPGSRAGFAGPRRLTRLNPHLEGVALGRSRLIRWHASGDDAGGAAGRAALLLPAGHRPGERAPLVASIYPGLPLADWLRRWDADAGAAVLHPQLLASAGYAVLLPDLPSPGLGVLPRGRELAAAVLAAVGEAVRLGAADPERLGVIGHSAGATAVNRLLAETDRFRAAVSAAGVGDLASFFGQLRVRRDGTPDAYGVHVAEEQCGGPPWAAPDRYAAESPVFLLDQVRTPLLLVHGTDDDAVGVEQAGELFVGLRRLGRTATLLRYRGEGHAPARFAEANRRDLVSRVTTWFGEHLAPRNPRA